MCAEILLKARADPDAANFDGERPLHYAAKCGHLEVAKVLLEYGAATHLRSRHRKTPLDLCQKIAVESRIQNGHCRSGQNCTFKHDLQKKGTGLGRKQGKTTWLH
jgi:hypothetical protein